MDNEEFYDQKQNMERIAEVEKLFGFPSNKLVTSNRVLIGEGVLTKICRRKPKLRHFFLFNDVLMYGKILVNRKVLRNPQFIDLSESSIKNVVDNGIYRNGFSILSPKKSFTVYASTAEEKTQWMVHLKKCISCSLSSTVQNDSVAKSPIWIPDSEASHCMVCGTKEFNIVHRRKLVTSNRVLIGEGVLTKICRRKPKLRHFFLFNDVLMYGKILVNRKVLRNPQFIDLSESSIKNVVDNGIYRNGFSILSPKKSFTVYASTAEEKTQWMVHLKKCISCSLSSTVQNDSVAKSPIWIPDSEASHCMVCGTKEFNIVHRRHHCRHCGKVVCDKCSAYRCILPYQGSSRVRVCSLCHTDLSTGRNSLVSSDDQQQQQQPQQQQSVDSSSCSMNSQLDSTVDVGTVEDNGTFMPTYLGDVDMNNDEISTESDTDSDNIEEYKVDKFISS
ncbi:unnamed protein product [Schistosoma turkestanicum]|nr:unnamed protein product [Schistosoma turkestanicum]